MIENAVQRLEFLCDTVPALLENLDEQAFSLKPHPGKWSKKEIIGHLADSATNNHHRLIRAQFEEIPRITYHQDEWNRYGYYDQLPGSRVIAFWEAYNRHLLELIRHIPEEGLLRKCNTGGEENVTLAFLVNDYVSHLEHHLRQVIIY